MMKAKTYNVMCAESRNAGLRVEPRVAHTSAQRRRRL